MRGDFNSKVPKVSIIVPARNAQDTLPDTLASTIAQTMRDWEVIVVDDGSTDRTRKVCRDFVKRDDRIRALTGAGIGPGPARNLALGVAQGEWVVFLDADDTLPPRHLETMLAAARENPGAELLYCGWRRLNSAGALLGDYPPPAATELFETSARRCPFAIHAAVTRRTTLLEASGFDESLLVCEDWDLWQRIARTAPPVWAVFDCRVDVIVRANSLSNRRSELLRNGVAIIDRGCSVDCRVTGAAALWTNGSARDDSAGAKAYLTFWLVGAAIGARQDIEPLLAAGAAVIIESVGIFAAATTFLDGVRAGAAQPFNEQWPALLRTAGPAITRFCNWLEEMSPVPQFGLRFLRAVEQEVGTALPPGLDARVGDLQIRTIDLARPITDIDPGAGVVRLRGEFRVGDRDLGQFETIVFGRVPAEWQRDVMFNELDRTALRDALEQHQARIPKTRLRRIMESGSIGSALAAAKGTHRWDREAITVSGLLDALDAPSAERCVPLRAGAVATPFHDARTIIDGTLSAKTAQESGAESDAPWQAPDYASQAYWESVFGDRDPWEYDNSYETLKYRQTLAALPPGRIGRALELACAEGHFTQLLAGRVESLLATDIAPPAVERAAERCAQFHNAEFARLDLLTDPIPGRFDLIVCSEVLYYVHDGDALWQLVEKFADALTDDGALVVAHGNLLVDDPNSTGFPWPHGFGAKRIGEYLSQHPALQLEHEVRTPLYRIQRFRRTHEALVPTIELTDAAKRLPDRVAQQVRWRGGRDIGTADSWHDFPILMYHRIATDGPSALAQYRLDPSRFEAQLALLRAEGWSGLSLDRLILAVWNRQPLPPKSVMLTFDDAYCDFAESALPLLHRYEFPATVFAPAGKLGGYADWDAYLGEPAPLLTAEDVRRLVDNDVAIGSHGHSHRALPTSSPGDQFRELANSRAELAQLVGRAVDTIAYPFGDYTAALRRAAADCGYHAGFTCDHGWVTAAADPLLLPRIEVRADYDSERFAQVLGIR